MITEFDYEEALKLARKEYKRATNAGESPYPARLDEIVSSGQLAAGRPVGLESIPLALVIGMRSEGRKNAFARNFMPLLETGSEFAVKWKALCHAHLTEGIRDPIRAYEYKNRFYVEEGNKRVSILKYFDADSIDAEVIRIQPAKEDFTEDYRAFLRFHECSGLRTVEFSDPASYDLLQRLAGLAPGEAWPEDLRRDFVSMYYWFHREYSAMGGDGSLPGVCDALLKFVRLCASEEASDKVPPEAEASDKVPPESEAPEVPVEPMEAPDPAARDDFRRICQMSAGEIRRTIDENRLALGLKPRAKISAAARTIGTSVTGATEEAVRKAPELTKAAVQKAPELTKAAVQRAPELTKTAVRKAPELTKTAVQKAPELTKTAVQKAPELTKTAVQKAPELTKTAVQKAPELTKTAVSRGMTVVRNSRHLIPGGLVETGAKIGAKISTVTGAVSGGRTDDDPKSRRPMRILAVADDETRQFYEDYREGNLDGFDLILACGDLPRVYLEFLTTMASCPVLYIRGNHDDPLLEEPPGGCICVEDRVYVHEGLRIAGLGGSFRYSDGKNMFTERQMQRRMHRLLPAIRKNGGLDILMTHAPARGLGDFESISHRGFESFRWLLDRWHPAYMVHGHIHKNYGVRIPQKTEWNGTTIINAYEHCVFEIDGGSYGK